MTDLLIGSIIVASVAAVMTGLTFLGRSVRRRGTAGPAIGAAMAAYDEAMHSTAHDRYVEMQAEDDRTIPAPSPDRL